MTARRTTLAAAAATLLAAAVLTPAVAAPAAPPGGSADPAPVDVDAMAADHLAAELGLDAGQARDRVAAQDSLAATATDLEAALGAASAGSWIDQTTGTLVVATTDAGATDGVRAAGAEAVVVEHSLSDLEASATAAADAGESVKSSYVDVTTNEVVVTVAPGTAADVAATVGADVRVEETPGTVSTQADLLGGQQIEFSGYVCSVGFTATRAGAPVFITAGHCAEGNQRFTRNGVYLGDTRGWSFPGNDYAYSSIGSGWTPRDDVTRYNGTAVDVSGSSNAPVGTAVCKSGRTTGWTCGTVQAKNVTVNYAEGAVGGLTKSTACTEGGDSGGSWMAGSLAQGVTSGGASINGRCLQVYGYPNETYFQPIGEVLSAYGLTLRTT